MPSCRLSLRVIPNAPRSEVVGWLGEALKLKIHAPALEGRANDEVCAFLAETLELPKRSVQLVQGDKSRQKVVSIDGLEENSLRQRLETLLKSRG